MVVGEDHKGGDVAEEEVQNSESFGSGNLALGSGYGKVAALQLAAGLP